jgi:hypothetical protein
VATSLEPADVDEHTGIILVNKKLRGRLLCKTIFYLHFPCYQIKLKPFSIFAYSLCNVNTNFNVAFK